MPKPRTTLGSPSKSAGVAATVCAAVIADHAKMRRLTEARGDALGGTKPVVATSIATSSAAETA